MSPQGRRIRWWLVVGLCQVGLLYLAGQAFAHRTVITWGGWFVPSATGQYIFYGWPIVWSEDQQQGDRVGDRIFPGPPIRYDSGPSEFKGQNLAVPALMFALAICLPPVVASLLPRRRGPDGIRVGPSRRVRLARVGLFTAAIGLTITALELETGICVFRLREPGVYGRVSTASGMYGPTYFLDCAIDHCLTRNTWTTLPDTTPAFGPATPRIMGSTLYQKLDSRLLQYRHELTGKPNFSAPAEEWPRPEELWQFRTRLTLYATGLGLVLGCLVFRPWRRAGGPSASDGAAATTPPSA